MQLYFNSMAAGGDGNGDPTDPNNIWEDPSCTIPHGAVSGSADNLTMLDNATQMSFSGNLYCNALNGSGNSWLVAGGGYINLQFGTISSLTWNSNTSIALGSGSIIYASGILFNSPMGTTSSMYQFSTSANCDFASGTFSSNNINDDGSCTCEGSSATFQGITITFTSAFNTQLNGANFSGCVIVAPQVGSGFSPTSFTGCTIETPDYEANLTASVILTQNGASITMIGSLGVGSTWNYGFNGSPTSTFTFNGPAGVASITFPSPNYTRVGAYTTTTHSVPGLYSGGGSGYVTESFMLIKHNSSNYAIPFFMSSSTTPGQGVTGLSPVVKISKAGGAFATPSGAVTEIGLGWYQIAGNSTDSNTLGALSILATGAGAINFTAVNQVTADPEFNPAEVLENPNNLLGTNGSGDVTTANPAISRNITITTNWDNDS